MALTACRGGGQACRAMMAMLDNISHQLNLTGENTYALAA